MTQGRWAVCCEWCIVGGCSTFVGLLVAYWKQFCIMGHMDHIISSGGNSIGCWLHTHYLILTHHMLDHCGSKSHKALLISWADLLEALYKDEGVLYLMFVMVAGRTSQCNTRIFTSCWLTLMGLQQQQVLPPYSSRYDIAMQANTFWKGSRCKGMVWGLPNGQ